MEAMDETAEWRQKYDWELERASNCERELSEVMLLFLSSLLCQKFLSGDAHSS